jgi:hypothetical protein
MFKVSSTGKDKCNVLWNQRNTTTRQDKIRYKQGNHGFSARSGLGVGVRFKDKVRVRGTNLFFP